ncbi:MAG: aldo/keto reductase, partial [Armatimonadetes bacterium]|nr:aldo/keto reductase [Armatimonadota bacterium]
EESIVPFCLENEISIVTYSSIAQGLLTGKFSPAKRPEPEDNRSRNKLFQSPTFEAALEAIETVRRVGEQYGKTPAQTAIRWVVQQPGITSAIVGGRNPRQVQENVGAAGWELSDEDIETLTSAGDDVMSTLPDEDLRMWTR